MKKIISISILMSLFYFNVAFADKVAIIGGGASGLITAWLLEENHDVTLYEAKDRLGGHAESIKIKVEGESVTIDTGFEFFNETFYPHLLKLIRHFALPLKVFPLETIFYKTDGSDQIILPPLHDGKIEWGTLSPANLIRALQFKTVTDNGRKLLASSDMQMTLETFADSLMLTRDFKTTLLYPLLAACWGVSTDDIRDFTAYDTLKYLVESRDTLNFKWYEIPEGINTYIDAVAHALQKTHVKLNARVTQMGKNNGHYTITATDGSLEEYDKVIFATDAKVASTILAGLPETADLAGLLGRIKYYPTKIAIHSDERFMPPHKEDWRVANIRYDGKNSAMTIYKKWKSKTPIFRSWLSYDVRPLNDTGDALPNKLYAFLYYQHPIVDRTYFEVQKTIAALQGQQNIWFSGMWTFDNDSHESAVISAIKVANELAPDSARLKIIN